MSILGVLGTIHDDEMRKKFDYSLERMEELIEKFNPDVICGEVRPEDWEKYCDNNEYEGYLGPNEYRRLIIPLCKKKGIKFIPVDWFEDDLKTMDYYQGKSEKEIKAIEKEFEAIMDDYWKYSKGSKIPFNSLGFNHIVEKKHNFQESINSEVEDLYWICRNKIMIERIKKVLSVNEGKRVLCTVGAEHNYFYYKKLEETNWEVIYPLE